MAKRQGWQRGDGAKGDNSLPIVKSRAPLPETAKHTDLSEILNTNDDEPTRSGHRDGFA